MKRKITVLLSVCLAMVFFLCGCKPKTALSMEQFISKAETFGCITQEIEQTDEAVKSGTIAAKTEGEKALWTVEFYVLASEENAKAAYETNKAKFEEGSGSSTYKSAANYSVYEKNGDGKFKYLCRVDSTFLYINVDSEYKDTVKDFIDKLGY